MPLIDFPKNWLTSSTAIILQNKNHWCPQISMIRTTLQHNSPFFQCSLSFLMPQKQSSRLIGQKCIGILLQIYFSTTWYIEVWSMEHFDSQKPKRTDLRELIWESWKPQSSHAKSKQISLLRGSISQPRPWPLYGWWDTWNTHRCHDAL